MIYLQLILKYWKLILVILLALIIGSMYWYIKYQSNALEDEKSKNRIMTQQISDIQRGIQTQQEIIDAIANIEVKSINNIKVIETAKLPTDKPFQFIPTGMFSTSTSMSRVTADSKAINEGNNSNPIQ